MKLQPHLVADWPKLAWAASFTAGATAIDLYHGPMVEVRDGWAAEAVWAGDFEAGDFDRTDLVFGSGVRCRDGAVVFVTSATAMDRLWYFPRGGKWYVSNSLGALSACSHLDLLEDHDYAAGPESTVRTTWGLASCVRRFPTQTGEGSLIWFSNLRYDGRALQEVPKPDLTPPFETFEAYHGFLVGAAERLGANLASLARRHAVTPIATVSSGYDSPAAAVIARHAGCRRAVTIRQATSLWRGSDSGEAIARRLGMECSVCNRTARVYPNEVAVWAASGYCNLLNWTLFDYPEPLSAFFLGNYGDAVWSRRKMPEPFTINICDDLGASELRLIVGMWQCVVPFWGLRRAEDIQRITFSDEMAPWTLHTGYDRPIPRRIIEEAGVPRGSFAVRKKNTSHETPFKWPYSPQARTAFREYLRARGRPAPSSWTIALIHRLAHLDSLIHNNLMARLHRRKGKRPWDRLSDPSLLFRWGNHELRHIYEAGLLDVGPRPAGTASRHARRLSHRPGTKSAPPDAYGTPPGAAPPHSG